jgi:hypothetical protein
VDVRVVRVFGDSVNSRAQDMKEQEMLRMQMQVGGGGCPCCSCAWGLCWSKVKDKEEPEMLRMQSVRGCAGGGRMMHRIRRWWVGGGT